MTFLYPTYFLIFLRKKKDLLSLWVGLKTNFFQSGWQASSLNFIFGLNDAFFFLKKKYFLNKVEFMMMNCFMKNKKVCDYSWRHLISLFCIPLFLCKTPC